MDSRAFWFGVALALAVLLLWRRKGSMLTGGVSVRNGVPASSGSPAGTGATGKDCGCGCSSGGLQVVSPFTAPAAYNLSAPAAKTYTRSKAQYRSDPSAFIYYGYGGG